MAHINTRLLDASEEHLNTLIPLLGYATKRLVSLKEAVLELRELVNEVDARVWTATNRCRNPADKLTQDESAAIVLYTIDWDPDHPSLYSILNRTLRLEDRRKLVPWFSYLKLFLTALFKLPSIRCTVWRGVLGDLRSQYKQGDNVTWWAFSSCTITINVLESSQYLGTSGPRTLFAIDCLNGKDIKRHSYYAQEEEILLLPCTHFEVISHLSSMENLYIIHLREVPPPFTLLEPPNSGSAGSGADKPSYEQLQSKLEQVNNENERLKVQCKQQQANIDKLGTENQVLNQICADFEDELQRLKQDNRRLKQESQQHNQEIVRLSNEIPKHKEEIQRVKQDNHRLKQEVQQCDQEIQSLNDQIRILKQEIERLKLPSAASNERPRASLTASNEQMRTSLAASTRKSGE